MDITITLLKPWHGQAIGSQMTLAAGVAQLLIQRKLAIEYVAKEPEVEETPNLQWAEKPNAEKRKNGK